MQSYPEIFQARKLGMNVWRISPIWVFYNTSNIVTRAELQQKPRGLKGFIKGQIEACN